jgi:hypothetical protein
MYQPVLCEYIVFGISFDKGMKNLKNWLNPLSKGIIY